jgi:hypothetical protein
MLKLMEQAKALSEGEDPALTEVEVAPLTEVEGAV